MKPEDLLEKLRSKPYETRVRILWSTVIVIGVLLAVIWITSLRGTIKSFNTRDLLKTAPQSTITSAVSDKDYVSIERVDKLNSGLRIYFNVKNETDDILNFPQTDDITLTAEDQTLHPIQILDRQNQPFVVKVLSHTQNFGILVFPPVGADSAKLTVDEMSFEKTAENSFHQDFDLNFNDLQTPNKLRN